MATPMPQRDPSLEQRTSELQLQIEQVSVALQQIRHTHDTLQQMETRLAEMTSECAGILDRWAKNDERHASAVAELHGRLSEWNDLERKLLSESATRIYQFERSVQHEWQALRQKHEEPLQKMDAQASRIAENCLAAVDAALRGFDRAETRLLALEQELQRQMSELSRDVRDALSEFRQPSLHLSASRPWPLEDVVRLHSELRSEANATEDPRALEEPRPATLAPHTLAGPSTPVKPSTPGPPGTEDASSTADSTPAHAPGGSDRRAWIVPAIVIGVLVVASVLYLRQRLDAGLSAATSRAVAAERGAEEARQQAREEISAVQRTAEQRIESAQLAALSAQLTANVLAAPDLYRLDLPGTPNAPRASAQVLWSRSRGIVFSGSRLPAAPDGSAYHLWMVTGAGPVAVGVVRPDENGRASAGFEPPASLPRPVTGALLTLEPDGSPVRPTGDAYLSAPPTPSPTPAS